MAPHDPVQLTWSTEKIQQDFSVCLTFISLFIFFGHHLNVRCLHITLRWLEIGLVQRFYLTFFPLSLLWSHRRHKHKVNIRQSNMIKKGSGWNLRKTCFSNLTESSHSYHLNCDTIFSRFLTCSCSALQQWGFQYYQWGSFHISVECKIETVIGKCTNCTWQGNTINWLIMHI